MDLSKSIKMLKTERQLILRGIENLSNEQLLKIPEGGKNNILWNLGHIIVTQQVLHYTLSRLEMRIPKEISSIFRTGTSPEVWRETPNITELKSLLPELPDKLLEDYNNGMFKEFRPYKTSTGVELNTFEDAITFNHFHEGTHTGIILGLIKRL
ncbi:MAG: DinB family protein [Ignavibacteriales bacterium]|nr:DinB family protein [Ignavibacteriales bacterium]